MIKTGIKHTDIIFIDIETASVAHEIFHLSATPSLAIAWNTIHESKYKDELTDDGKDKLGPGSSFQKYAALYPEFGKIVCISLGHFKNESEFCVKAYYGNRDEKALLDEVSAELTKLSASKKYICGHNIKNFDIPFMIRRAVIVGTSLNTPFDIYGRKPWDIVEFIDTMDMWSAGAFNLGSRSLESMCAAFGMKNPKEEMHGNLVSTLFYMPGEEGLPKIGKYCNFDVISVSACYCKMTKGDFRFMKLAPTDNIY